VKAMELDDAASRMKRATGLLEWSKQQSQKFDFAESLEKFRDGMKEQHGKPGGITHKGAADDGGIGPAYIIYRELSGNAAHPSATSLSRHMVPPAQVVEVGLEVEI
jgi:DNA topoisomerase IB